MKNLMKVPLAANAVLFALCLFWNAPVQAQTAPAVQPDRPAEQPQPFDQEPAPVEEAAGETAGKPRIPLTPSSLASNSTEIPYWYSSGLMTGYVKLVTPIVRGDGNLFSIRIIGYDFLNGNEPMDILCSGYASGTFSSYSRCETTGTDRPVDMAAEVRTEGSTTETIVIRIGTPDSGWQTRSFAAHYYGRYALDGSQFTWTVGETTPAPARNLNNIIAFDNAGTMTTTGSVAVGTTSLDPFAIKSSARANSLVVGAPAGTSAGVGAVQLLANETGAAAVYFGTTTAASGIIRRAAITAPDPSSLRFFVNPTNTGTGISEAMRIWSNGNITVGTTAAQSQKFYVSGDAHFTGNLTGGTIQAHYQDIAEWVPSSVDLAPGTVVIVHPERPNEVMASAEPYDTRVAGVVSAQPGLILGQGDASKEQIATTGRVKVRVDARNRPVRIGDLLVTGILPGTAVVSEPIDVGGRKIHQPGTLLGKALEALPDGVGEVLVLLSLQ